MKSLKLHPIVQTSNECLPACLKMALDFYGRKVSEKEIIDSISANSSKLYDWEFKAGKLACEQKMKAEIFSNVGYLFDPSWSDLSQKDLLKKLEEELAFSKKREEMIAREPAQKSFIFPNKVLAQRYTSELSAAIAFLKAGGKINFNPVSKELIEKFIDQNNPVIMSIDAPLLYKLRRAYKNKPDDIKGSSWGHVIIVSGYDEENFRLTDPDGMFYKGALEYSISQDSLLESFLRYNGQLLLISR